MEKTVLAHTLASKKKKKKKQSPAKSKTSFFVFFFFSKKEAGGRVVFWFLLRRWKKGECVCIVEVWWWLDWNVTTTRIHWRNRTNNSIWNNGMWAGRLRWWEVSRGKIRGPMLIFGFLVSFALFTGFRLRIFFRPQFLYFCAYSIGEHKVAVLFIKVFWPEYRLGFRKWLDITYTDVFFGGGDMGWFIRQKFKKRGLNVWSTKIIFLAARHSGGNQACRGWSED